MALADHLRTRGFRLVGATEPDGQAGDTAQAARQRGGLAMRRAEAACIRERLAEEQRVRRHALQAFEPIGLGIRSLNALHASGIDKPERLLSMSEDSIARVPGIGKVALDKIRSFRNLVKEGLWTGTNIDTG